MDKGFDWYYGKGAEQERLIAGGDRLELVRTLEVLAPLLPPAPARVLDVGGGPGVYASRLADAGYEVDLIDIVPRHVEQALELGAGTFGARVGDARDLSAYADASVDVVLLFGPLYHLTERADRVRALSEARRVVRPGGVVVAAAISRYASLLAGALDGFLEDERFVAIVERDLAEGQHRNNENVDGWFTTSFFHLPEELAAEIEEAGLTLERLSGVEGPGGWVDFWPQKRELVLRAARLAEGIPALSAHMLGIATR